MAVLCLANTRDMIELALTNIYFYGNEFQTIGEICIKIILNLYEFQEEPQLSLDDGKGI